MLTIVSLTKPEEAEPEEAETERGAVPLQTTEPALWEAWDGFFAAVRRARGRAARQQGNDLTLSQSHLLSLLAETPRARVGELAEAAGVAPPTATRMVDSLERAGVVKRSSSPDDRRVVEVALTPKGKRLLADKHELMRAQRRALEESLQPQEREQAERLLRRLAEAIDEL